jgi:hypothetical protein
MSSIVSKSSAFAPCHPRDVTFYRGLSLISGFPIRGTLRHLTPIRGVGPAIEVSVANDDFVRRPSRTTGVADPTPTHIRRRFGLTNPIPFAPKRGTQRWPQTKAATEVPLDGVFDFVDGKYLRIGCDGDPVGIPFDVWNRLLTHASGWSCYTREWRGCDDRFKQIAMALVDSIGEQAEAGLRGWRTFRVRRANEKLKASETVCPASVEAGSRSNCVECGLCCGLERAAQSVAIIAR